MLCVDRYLFHEKNQCAGLISLDDVFVRCCWDLGEGSSFRGSRDHQWLSLTWNICFTFFKLSSEARGMARLIWGYINSMASHVHWFTHALEGQDIIAISATGSGKSAYYIYMLAIVLVALGKRPVVRVVFWLVCPTTVLKEDLVTYVHDLYHYQSGYIIHSVGSQNENIQSQG